MFPFPLPFPVPIKIRKNVFLGFLGSENPILASDLHGSASIMVQWYLFMVRCRGYYRLNTQPNFKILGLSESYKFCLYDAPTKYSYTLDVGPKY